MKLSIFSLIVFNFLYADAFQSNYGAMTSSRKINNQERTTFGILKQNKSQNRNKNTLLSYQFGDQASYSVIDYTQNGYLLAMTSVFSDAPAEGGESEAEILRDLSHVLWDVFSFLDPDTLVLRVLEVVGRLLVIGSDYVEDKIFLPDDLFFQIACLSFSIRLLSHTAIPIIKANFVTTTERDELVFSQLFEPVGVRWIQYKALVAEGIIDWIKVDPHTLLVCEKNKNTLDGGNDLMYWLMDGDVEISFQNIKIHEETSGKAIEDPTAFGLLGDMRFLYDLDKYEKEKRIRKGKKEVEMLSTNKYPMATTRTGRKGATMMRLKGNLLLKQMENDEGLYKSVKYLLLKSLQRKVSAYLLNNVGNKSLQEIN